MLGKGFVLSPEEAEALIAKDPRNKDVLFPYLNGDDLNNDPEQRPSRWVVNFFDWPEEKARTYPDCFEIVEKLVKPERMQQNDKGGKEKWWQFLRPRNELYKTISQLDQVMVIAQVSKTLAFTFVPTSQVISMMCVVLAFDDYISFSLMQNSLHKEWVQKYASALKADTRYTPSDVFETYPLPRQIPQEIEEKLMSIGKEYYEFRSYIMKKVNIGLTKLYNQFHNSSLVEISTEDDAITGELFEKQHGKDSWWLKRHLQNVKTATYNEVVKLVNELRGMHIKLDLAVIEAYGWADIHLLHSFYEIESLPENDRTRFSIHPDARKYVLGRLLQLNHQLYAETSKIKLDKNMIKAPLVIDLFTDHD